MGAVAAKPTVRVGDTVSYHDRQGRHQVGEVKFIEAKWWFYSEEPSITYQVTHPTYRNNRHYTGDVTPTEKEQSDE